MLIWQVSKPRFTRSDHVATLQFWFNPLKKKENATDCWAVCDATRPPLFDSNRETIALSSNADLELKHAYHSTQHRIARGLH